MIVLIYLYFGLFCKYIYFRNIFSNINSFRGKFGADHGKADSGGSKFLQFHIPNPSQIIKITPFSAPNPFGTDRCGSSTNRVRLHSYHSEVTSLVGFFFFYLLGYKTKVPLEAKQFRCFNGFVQVEPSELLNAKLCILKFS